MFIYFYIIKNDAGPYSLHRHKISVRETEKMYATVSGDEFPDRYSHLIPKTQIGEVLEGGVFMPMKGNVLYMVVLTEDNETLAVKKIQEYIYSQLANLESSINQKKTILGMVSGTTSCNR